MKYVMSCVPVFLAVQWLLCIPATAEIADTIIRRNGPSLEKVSVTSDTYLRVKYEMKGPAGKVLGEFAGDDVLDIYYGDAPVAYRTAKSSLEAGDLEKAAKKFDDARAQTVSRPWFPVYVAFGKAECLRLSGKPKEAIALYEEAIKRDPKSRLVPPSSYGIGQCYLDLGGDSLKEAFGRFTEIGGKDFSPIWRFRARCGKALVKETQGLKARDADQATQAAAYLEESLKLYGEIVEIASSLDEGKKEFDHADERFRAALFDAKLHRGAVLVALDKKDDAEEWFGSIVADVRDESAKAARAYNARGDCFFGFGDHRRALWDYLRVSSVYFTENSQHKYAVERCIECFGQLRDRQHAEEYAALLERHHNTKLEPVMREADPEPVDPKVSETEPGPDTDRVKMLETVKVQLGQKVLGTAEEGKHYKLLSVQGGWGYVELPNGSKGYVSLKKAEVIKAAAPTPTPEVEEEKKTNVVTVKAESTVVYDGDEKEVKKAKKGEVFPVVEEAEGWYGIVVTVDGKEVSGWIDGSDVDYTPPVEKKKTNIVTVKAESTVVYDGDQKEVRKAKKGEVFSVVEEAEGWYGIKVTVGEKEISGWIDGNDVDYTPPEKK